MIDEIYSSTDVPNGDQVAGAANYKCTANCQGCMCDKYHLQFNFTDDDDVPYANVNYVAYLPNGKTQQGTTDNKGFTEIFRGYKKEEIAIHLNIND